MAYKPGKTLSTQPTIPVATPTGGPAASGAQSQLAALKAGGTINTGAQAGANGAMIPITFGTLYAGGPGAGHTQSYNHDASDDGPNRPKSHSFDNVQQFGVDANSVNNAVNAWYQFDDQRRGDLASKMWYLGLIKSPHDFNTAFNVWASAVQHAAGFAAAGRSIDPQNVLDMMGDGQGLKRNTGVTQKTQSIDLSDPASAREWIKNAFQQSMGRDPTDPEIRTLTDALHKRQTEDPSVTVKHQTYDANGNLVDSKDTYTGGSATGDTSAQSFIAAQTANDPEAGAHQAAATLYPALMQALKAG